MSNRRWDRRDFLRLGALSGLAPWEAKAKIRTAEDRHSESSQAPCHPPFPQRKFNDRYDGIWLDQIAFPLGGLGAGMICLEGSGALSQFSLHHRPNLANQPQVFAALAIKGREGGAKVLEGPLPAWKLKPRFPGARDEARTGCWGLPRFRKASFRSRFPFATVSLVDDTIPVEVELTGWSPFSPGHSDDSSLPVAALEYRFTNCSSHSVEAVFSFNAENFMASSYDPNSPPRDRIKGLPGGFLLHGAGSDQRPWDEGYCAIWVDGLEPDVNCAWFRSSFPEVWGMVEALQMVWRDIETGRHYDRPPLSEESAPGASLSVPLVLAPGETKSVDLKLAWYVPKSNLSEPDDAPENSNASQTQAPPLATFQPWYASRFASIEEVFAYWRDHYPRLRHASETFTQSLYDSTLPPELLEAVAANLSILKSPTILRQADGRLWGWEGCHDSAGADPGSSTHVWNYAQAIPHLFPDLERTLRETELGADLGKDGFQVRRAALPIRPVADNRDAGDVAAADGQLGSILKTYRDWRISGDTAWLRDLWPKIRASLDFCIRTWDPRHRGLIEEPHLTTYDVVFWGADSLCTSLYLSALKAATLMGEALKENVDGYSQLLSLGTQAVREHLFNGEYFVQKTEWKSLRTRFPQNEAYPSLAFFLSPKSEDELALAEREGPPYQYGSGCLSDGVMGCWMSLVCGLDEVIDAGQVKSHLHAVYRYNFKRDFAGLANLARTCFACEDDAGLLLCTWPSGGEPTRPFFYSTEVWSGVEYQVASHLISVGQVEEGLEIVRACRLRYDGRIRNPYDEVEDGHWYARAMSSYALLQAYSGTRFDAVDRILYLKPPVKGDFRCFLSTATGFGTVGVHSGRAFVEVASGEIPYERIEYVPA